MVPGCGGGGDALNPAAFLGPVKRVQVGPVNYGYYRFGSGPPLVLIGGLGSTTSSWTLPLLHRLSRRHELIVFDNRGIGFSTDADRAPLTIQSMASSTVGLLDALALERPDVLGWSMGGKIALTLAALHGDKVGKVVAVSADAGSTNTVPPSQEVLDLLMDPDATPDQILELFFPEDEQAAAARYAVVYAAMPRDDPQQEALPRQAEAIARFVAAQEVWDRLPEVSNPVLLIAGAEDVVTPAENSERVAERLPNAELVTVPDAGHAVLFQEEDALVPLIESFLGGG